MKLAVSQHAIARYKERVKPALDFEPAKRELEALLAGASTPADTPPDWLYGEHPLNQGYIEIADGIVAGVQEGVVTTILTRGGSHPARRAYKNDRRRRKRAVRATKSKNWPSNARPKPDRRVAWD